MNTEDKSTTTATTPAPASTLKATPKRTARRPGQTLACGWGGSSILVPARGRVPKWCSSSCRHRAWELTRAAASGLAAVQVIDRAVQVDRPVTVNERVEVEVVPHGPAWPHALAQLTEQIDTGKVYDRDLPALAAALGDVRSALNRRPVWHRQHPS